MVNHRSHVDYFNEFSATYEERVHTAHYAGARHVFEAARTAAGGLHSRGTSRILDIGTGTGLLARLLRSEFGNAHITGLDASRGMLDEARRQGGLNRLVPHDLTAGRLPFRDKSFDIVTSASVLEYIRDPAPVLTEMARVTKPGRPIVFTTRPIDVELSGHQTGFERRSLRKRFGMTRSSNGAPDTYSHARRDVVRMMEESGVKFESVRLEFGYQQDRSRYVFYDVFSFRKPG